MATNASKPRAADVPTRSSPALSPLPSKPRKRPVRALLVFCSGALLAACHSAPPPAARTAAGATLQWREAYAQSLPAERAYAGVIEAVQQTVIAAQASGRIVELPVDVDDSVRAGDVLARLRDAEPRARLQQAQAAVREAQAQAEQAQSEYLRVKSVYDKQLIAPAQMDRASAARDAAAARLAQARAAVKDAGEQQDYTVIRAPYDGIITARPAQLGELAAPGQALLQLLSLQRLRAVVDVPQTDIAAVRDRRQASVQFDDGRRLDAADLHIFPYADAQTHSVRVRVDLPAPTDAAPAAVATPGARVRVVFTTGERTALAIPPQALAWRGEVAGVYLADGARNPYFQAVRLGDTLGDGRICILSGLRAGDRYADDARRAAQELAAAAAAPT